MRTVTGLLLAALCCVGATDNWPQFRGVGSNGVAEDDPRLPEEWSSTKNVVWKVEVPGRGWSSPVVWGKRVYVTSVVSSQPKEAAKKGLYFGGERAVPSDEHRWMVYAYDFETGKLVWEREVHRAVPEFSRHLKNSYASETPVTDGQMVYAYFGNVGLFALDAAGKVVWEKRAAGAVKTRYGWGTAASPVLHQGRLYVVNDNDTKSVLTAYDKKSGKVIWQVDREEKSNWSTPFVWEGKRTEIVVPGTGKVRSYDLDGKVLWEFGGMSSIMIPTPFTRHGLLYVTSGYVGDQNRPVYVVKPGGSGDISLQAGETSNAFVAWYAPQLGPYNPSPLVYGDIYYTLYDRGFFAAHDARTGKEIYPRRRIAEDIGAYTSSPWAYNGKIFVLNEDGDTHVIQAGPEYKVLGKNSVDEMAMATPAIARGSLFLRTESKLYRITKR